MTRRSAFYSHAATPSDPVRYSSDPATETKALVTQRRLHWSTEFDAETIEAFEPDAKIALLATIDESDLPHLTLITSLAAKDATTLMFGQFCEGVSKRNLAERPKAGFLVMTRDRRLWRGRAWWRGRTRQGEDYEAYNRRPMFRYNAYLGIHTVHYLDLVEVSPCERLSLPALAGIALRPVLARSRPLHNAPVDAPLSAWTRRLLARPGTLAFAAFLDEDGWPTVAPLVGVSAPDAFSLRVNLRGRGRRLESLPDGHPVALLALNRHMESVLMRGRLGRAGGPLGCRHRRLLVEWVYNSMPPKQGVVFPRPRILPVERF